MNTNLDYFIMGALMEGDKSGYDIKKVFELSPAPSATLSSGAIYPAIKRLEKEGILEKHLIVQNSKPNRNLLSLTSKGKDVFMEWLRSPVTPGNNEINVDPFSQKFLFFSYLDESEIRKHCSNHIQTLNNLIESMEKFKIHYHKCMNKYAIWNLEGSLVLFKARINWLNDILNELKESR